MICSMRLDGSTACMTIEGATDTEVFRAYVRRVLCPTLRQGDVVIMDNLCPHKSEPTLSLIARAGAEVLFLPAYSPEFNPIEKMWSKLKASLRSAEARTRPHLSKPSLALWGASPPKMPGIGLPIAATALFKLLLGGPPRLPKIRFVPWE